MIIVEWPRGRVVTLSRQSNVRPPFQRTKMGDGSSLQIRFSAENYAPVAGLCEFANGFHQFDEFFRTAVHGLADLTQFLSEVFDSLLRLFGIGHLAIKVKSLVQVDDPLADS